MKMRKTMEPNFETATHKITFAEHITYLWKTHLITSYTSPESTSITAGQQHQSSSKLNESESTYLAASPSQPWHAAHGTACTAR
jgi:hypothetical protein